MPFLQRRRLRHLAGEGDAIEEGLEIVRGVEVAGIDERVHRRIARGDAHAAAALGLPEDHDDPPHLLDEVAHGIDSERARDGAAKGADGGLSVGPLGQDHPGHQPHHAFAQAGARRVEDVAGVGLRRGERRVLAGAAEAVEQRVVAVDVAGAAIEELDVRVVVQVLAHLGLVQHHADSHRAQHAGVADAGAL